MQKVVWALKRQHSSTTINDFLKEGKRKKEKKRKNGHYLYETFTKTKIMGEVLHSLLNIRKIK